jgi:lipid-binding SYLF domain-containing protein
MTARLNLRLIATATMLAIATIFLVAPTSHAATKDEQRAEVKKVSNETLQRLYKVQPSAKAAIDKSAGYATFSNFGIKILVAGSGKGQGIAINKKTGKETYMKMLEAQAGLGFGVKKFRLVWVFETPAAFDNFVNSGWEASTQATAAAKKGDQGAWASGAVSVSPGVWLYQITDEGLALELTAKGTKYYKDDDLN